jgi:hypothetical protein
MNPVIFNCFLLYIFVILLSLLQSRFRIFKDDPIMYIILLILTPFMVLGKAKNIKTWTQLTAFEIVGYTLVMSMIAARRMVPKVNEGYIYAYTQFHWYLLIDSINRTGNTFWNIFVALLSLYPTILIVQSSFEHKKLSFKDKAILYYWFLFIVAYSFISQLAMHIINPMLTAYEISLESTLLLFVSAVQLYFISTVGSLLFVAIPLFHMDRTSEPFKVRWAKAMRDWRKLLKYKLDNYIEYQINTIQVVYITVASGFLFLIDASYASARYYTIVIYTIVLPLIYFYFKVVPDQNLEEEEPVVNGDAKSKAA